MFSGFATDYGIKDKLLVYGTKTIPYRLDVMYLFMVLFAITSLQSIRRNKNNKNN